MLGFCIAISTCDYLQEGMKSFGKGKLSLWDKVDVATIDDSVTAVLEIMKKNDTASLQNYKNANIYYAYHMTQGPTPGTQRPYECFQTGNGPSDLEYIRVNLPDFYQIVTEVTYNNDPKCYRHNPCGSTSKCPEYKLLPKLPPGSSKKWVHYSFMIGHVPLLKIITLVEYMGKGILTKKVYILILILLYLYTTTIYIYICVCVPVCYIFIYIHLYILLLLLLIKVFVFFF